jgi:hypothetical protein
MPVVIDRLRVDVRLYQFQRQRWKVAVHDGFEQQAMTETGMHRVQGDGRCSSRASTAGSAT